MFVLRDGKAVFTPVKTGVAGEQYFEVARRPQGRRPGDHRAVRLGARAGRRRGREAAGADDDDTRSTRTATEHSTRDEPAPRLRSSSRCRPSGPNKLRSFMTVLGNIVAVTSIVTVVSLIQGLNATVSDVIVSDIGADSFTIARRGIVRSGRGRGAHAQQPAADDARGRRHPRLRRQHRVGDRQRQPRRHGLVRDDGDGEHPDHRRHQRVRELLELQRRAGPDDDARPRSSAAGRSRSSAGTSPIGCSARRTRSTRRSASPASSSASSASARSGARRSASSQDGFAVIPLGAYMRLFGARQSLTLHGQAGQPRGARRGDGRRHGGAARRAAAEADRAGQLRHADVGHGARASTRRRPTASSPCSSASSPCRWSSAASSS